jgi:hypothetical protein
VLEDIRLEVQILVMIVKQDTIVQEVLTDKIVEQETIAQVQVEHNVKQDTHVQEALDQIVVSLYCILF